MLFVVFQIAGDRYAIDARELVEILPLVKIKQLPQAPAGVAGVLDYHGLSVPAIDVSAIALGTAAAGRISTRILIVENSACQRMALIAERANELLIRDVSEFTDTGVSVSGAPYLGPVTRDAHGLVQWITPDKLLSPEVRDALCLQMEEAA
ncbi:MAG: chemotaxis protein CheW [Chthoniobacteraceae bacterium]